MGGGAGFYAGTMPDRSVSRFLANVTRPAPLGSTVLYVDSTSQIKAGDWVRLWMIDAEATRGIYFTNKTDGTGSDNGTIIEETDGSRRRQIDSLIRVAGSDPPAYRSAPLLGEPPTKSASTKPFWAANQMCSTIT